jgi:hypothetical protein
VDGPRIDKSLGKLNFRSNGFVAPSFSCSCKAKPEAQRCLVPELEICPICKLSIKPEDQFVTLPPDPQRKFGEPIYDQHAHASCYDKVAAPLEKL